MPIAEGRFPDFHALDRAAWRAWLAEHHAASDGVWLVSFKKATSQPIVPYAHAVEEALCFGWVDSVTRTLDEDRHRLLYTPRRPGSGWAATNKERVGRLEAAGLLAPAGVAIIEAARRDGSWSALDAVEALEVPTDLRAALDARFAAAHHFDAFPKSARRGILEWIQNAKRPQTRAERIEETARLAAENVRANQFRRADRL